MEEPNTDAQLALTEQPNNEIPCPKCNRTFMSAQALRMHNARTHTGAILTVGQQGLLRGHTDEERRKKKLQYQRAIRERYYREGKNSRGKQMPPGWQPHGKKIGHKWTQEQTVKFKSTMRRKAKSKRIQIVYPEPGDNTPDIIPSSPINPHALNYCPGCGLHLTPIEAALAQNKL